MRLIFSRKGFDTASGGCPSPIFPDGSMLSLPIPDKRSPIRYRELRWRGRDVGELVETLTRGKQRRDFRAHLDPDLRPDQLPREPGWTPLLGQHASAQGHLRKHGVGPGDLFLFWGLFREVDASLRWVGAPRHLLWGWLQVGRVVNVDSDIRGAADPAMWSWAARHPHLSFGPESANTLYLAAPVLTLPDVRGTGIPGSGVVEGLALERQLTVPERHPLLWSLPAWFEPSGRPALSYHGDAGRWTRRGDRVLLRPASRGQEFVLPAAHYPEAAAWIAELLATR